MYRIAAMALLFFGSLCAGMPAKAQAIFQKAYEVPGYYTYGKSIAEGPNGHFMVLSESFDVSGPVTRIPIMMRTTPDGTSLWAKQYQVAGTMNDWAEHIEHVGNDRYLVTINHNFPDSSSVGYLASSVNLVDSAGNIIWTTALHDTTRQTDYWLNKTLHIGNANYSVGTTNIAHYINPYTDTTKLGLVAKTDTLGNLLWAKTYGTYATIFNDAVATDDGGMVITGLNIQYNDTTVPFSPVRLIYLKLDSAGNVVWSNSWLWPKGGDVYCIAKANNGFLIGGFYIPILNENAFILKIDNNGNLLWSNKYTGSGSSSIRIYHILERNNKILYSLGSEITIADTLGNNPIAFINNFLYKIEQLLPTRDGGIVRTGRKAIQPSQPYIFKYDSLFFGCDTLTAIPAYGQLFISYNNYSLPSYSISLPFSSLPIIQNSFSVFDSVFCNTFTMVLENNVSENQFYVYPNPSQDFCAIIIPEGVQRVHINIVDASGRYVQLPQNRVEHNKIILQTENLQVGLFLIQVLSEKNAQTFKIIKQ